MDLPVDMTAVMSDAKWIWTDAATRPYHNVVRFRREWTVAAADATKPAQLHITADSRYEVFLNGVWLGSGPMRAWINPWPVDTYDLTGQLREGVNAIEVVVQHHGLSTFQYLDAPPGLLARLDIAGRTTWATDATWQAAVDEAVAWPVPRISCMQAWEEQYDARKVLSWGKATVVESKHIQLETRPIPQLTRNPIAPVRVMAAEVVKPAAYSWNINPRDAANRTDKAANNIAARLLIVTYIHSPVEQDAQFHPPHHRPGTRWKLNGADLKFDDHSLQKTDTGVAKAKLKAGWNTLMGKLPEREHYWWAVLNIWGNDLTFSARPEKCDGPAWLTVGPFGDPSETEAGSKPDVHDLIVRPEHIHPEATEARFRQLWATGLLDAKELSAPFVEQAQGRMISVADAYATSASERVVSPAKVDHPTALLADNAEWTTLHPSPEGDIRLLLDFGREYIGHHEFDIDAGPDGTGVVIDNHNFEFIQPDGRFNLAEGMNNSFRYTCRAGQQTYRANLRRGFRYSWFSFRNLKAPLRVRTIRLLASTYPQARAGSFSCSDPALDRIWQVGANSVECCSEDTYTDCPTYEQTFWVGDARNEAMVDLIANGDPRLSARCLLLAARSLDRSPLVESQVPSGWQTVLPAWAFLWVRWVAEHFAATGDSEFGKAMLPYLERNADGVANNRSPRGLFNLPGWNMFDWANLDTPGEGEITHLQCLATLGLRQTAPMARSLGRPDLADKWLTLADSLAKAVNEHMWDDTKQAYIDSIHADGKRSTTFSQQTHTAAHIAGVPTKDRAARVRDVMLHAPEGFITAGSPFFMFFLLEAQASEGDHAGMLKTIRDYWGIQTDAGATTFWEMYWVKEKRMTRSHCHGWSAAPTYFLSRYILGIEPLDPGYAKVRITPPKETDLKWAQGTVPTPHGPIEVRWETKEGKPVVRATLPTGVTRVE